MDERAPTVGRHIPRRCWIFDTSLSDSTRKAIARSAQAMLWSLTLVASALAAPAGRAYASPGDPPDPPLPVVNVQPSSWQPKFPFPYDASRKDVTAADITAEREMCEWFNPQYRELVRQIDRLGFNLFEASNDWTVGQIQAQADAVAANIDQTEAFLAPRTQSLTQTQDSAGDSHFALFEGEAFYRLWQHLSNVGVGIRARNTAWVNGPSVERVKHWGSQIQRSHVCD
jgi:hypothetical protein